MTGGMYASTQFRRSYTRGWERRGRQISVRCARLDANAYQGRIADP